MAKRSNRLCSAHAQEKWREWALVTRARYRSNTKGQIADQVMRYVELEGQLHEGSVLND